jgi:hypothetical protein
MYNSKNKMAVIALLSMAIVLSFSTVAKADGFGEYAGFLIYNQSINTSHSEYWTLVNQFNKTLSFTISEPNITQNATVYPNITYRSQNGTILIPSTIFYPSGDLLTEGKTYYIPPESTYTINVTVFLPIGVTVNHTWSGYSEAIASTSSGNSSASVNIGTAKLLEINSEPQIIKKQKTTTTIPTNTTNTTKNTTKVVTVSSPVNNSSSTVMTLEYVVITLVIVIVAFMAYMLGSRKAVAKKQKK